MEYLENRLVKFKPLFKINYKIKKNLICCSLFKRNTSYYKDFSLYTKGLYKIYHSIIKDFSIRLFIDNSIYNDKEIMKLLNKLTKIELVLFKCPMFQEGDYHIGLFGTLIRFFPMFNFPNNDANQVIITDIDNYSFKKYIEILDSNNIDNLYLIKYSNASRMFKNKEDYNHIYNDIILDYIKPQEMICLKQINYNVILSFLENLDENIKYSYYLNENYKHVHNFKSKFENNGHFIYGIDEYFLNNQYLHYFIDNKLPFLNILKYNIDSVLYYQLFIRNEPWLEKNKKIFNELLNFILNKLDIKNMDKKNMIDKFKIIESKTKNKKILYDIFMNIKDKKKYNFMINYIYNSLLKDDKYKNVYEFIEHQFYFIENKNNYFIKKLFL